MINVSTKFSLEAALLEVERPYADAYRLKGLDAARSEQQIMLLCHSSCLQVCHDQIQKVYIPVGGLPRGMISQRLICN